MGKGINEPPFSFMYFTIILMETLVKNGRGIYLLKTINSKKRRLPPEERIPNERAVKRR